MTKIIVDVEELRRVADWLSVSGEDISLWGKSLLQATSDVVKLRRSVCAVGASVGR